MPREKRFEIDTRIRLSQEAANHLDQLAIQRETYRAAIIRQAITEYLAQPEQTLSTKETKNDNCIK